MRPKFVIIVYLSVHFDFGFREWKTAGEYLFHVSRTKLLPRIRDVRFLIKGV